MDDFEEIFAAAKPFEGVLTNFLSDYLAKYPSVDSLYERFDLGEVFRIDFKTLDIDVLLESELPLSEDDREEFAHNWSCPDFYFSDVLRLTRNRDGARVINEDAVQDVACHVLWRHLHGKGSNLPL